MSSIRYQFADFALDPNGVLTGPEGEVALRPRTFDLLHALVSQPDRVLSHDELLNKVWGVEHLSSSSLKQAISEIRKALDDDSSNPRYIQTVPRRGYRFVAEVEAVHVDPAPTAHPEPAPGATSPADPASTTSSHSGFEARSPTQRHLIIGLSFMAATLLVITAFLLGRSSGPGTDALPATEPSGVASSANTSARPIATMLGFRHDEVGAAPLASALASRVATALVGSGTEQDVPFQLIEQVRSTLRTDTPLADTVQAVGDTLGIDMLAAGSLRTNEDGTIDAQLALFDTRTGSVGAHSLVRAVSPEELRLVAGRLLNELWEWNGELPASAELSDLPSIDLNEFDVRGGLSTGIVVRRLRLTMATHASSGAEQPPFPRLQD